MCEIGLPGVRCYFAWNAIKCVIASTDNFNYACEHCSVNIRQSGKSTIAVTEQLTELEEAFQHEWVSTEHPPILCNTVYSLIQLGFLHI